MRVRCLLRLPRLLLLDCYTRRLGAGISVCPTRAHTAHSQPRVIAPCPLRSNVQSTRSPTCFPTLASAGGITGSSTLVWLLPLAGCGFGDRAGDRLAKLCEHEEGTPLLLSVASLQRSVSAAQFCATLAAWWPAGTYSATSRSRSIIGWRRRRFRRLRHVRRVVWVAPACRTVVSCVGYCSQFLFPPRGHKFDAGQGQARPAPVYAARLDDLQLGGPVLVQAIHPGTPSVCGGGAGCVCASDCGACVAVIGRNGIEWGGIEWDDCKIGASGITSAKPDVLACWAHRRMRHRCLPCR